MKWSRITVVIALALLAFAATQTAHGAVRPLVKPKHHPHHIIVWPPHHSLWLCIHSGEGGWHEPSHAMGYVNGHYTHLYWGGMQMHAGWGYGTSYHASDDSQIVQEWAAEKAYRASAYSPAFLYGQWAADARCF